MMLDRLGYQIEHEMGGHDFVASKDGRKCVVSCADPTQTDKSRMQALGRLMDVMIKLGAQRGFYITSREFSREAKDYAKTVAIELVDGKTLEKSMKASLANTKLPKVYRAGCCQCGDIVQHRLGHDELVKCRLGHEVAGTISEAAINPKAHAPPRRKGGAGADMSVMRALMAMNRRIDRRAPRLGRR